MTLLNEIINQTFYSLNKAAPITLVICQILLLHRIFNNWFRVSVCLWSYGYMQEVA